MAEIRLLLVDDHKVVRTGLRMLLESYDDMVIIGEASSGGEALPLIKQLKPDVVVMDLTLPDISGIEVTRLILLEQPNVHIVALTIHEDEQYFFEMLRAGATGYVPKRAAPEHLINAVRAANNGEVYIHPSLAKVLVKDFLKYTSDETEEDHTQELTPREKEVMELLADGLSNEEIATRLYISPHTVARHRENIMHKLNLHRRADLVRYAIRKGMIEA
ncbi:MAG TPA: response regulator transcription factor [Anaerolineales bacterium]|nr:response regulator transcription factor [Anaerolineales bacterium]